MKTILTLLAVLLMISLAGNWIQYKSAEEQANYRDQENERFRTEQVKKLTQIANMDAQIQALLDERKSDSLTHAKNQGALILEINRLKKRIQFIPKKYSNNELDSIIRKLYK